MAFDYGEHNSRIKFRRRRSSRASRRNKYSYWGPNCALKRVVGAVKHLVDSNKGAPTTLSVPRIADLCRCNKARKLPPLSHRSIERYFKQARTILRAQGYSFGQRATRRPWVGSGKFWRKGVMIQRKRARLMKRDPKSHFRGNSPPNSAPHTPIRGISFPKDKYSHPPSGGMKRLEALSFVLARNASCQIEHRMPETTRWWKKMNLSPLSKAIFLALKRGWWQEDILQSARKAARITDTAWKDGLAMNPNAYWFGVFSDLTKEKRPFSQVRKKKSEHFDFIHEQIRESLR